MGFIRCCVAHLERTQPLYKLQSPGGSEEQLGTNTAARQLQMIQVAVVDRDDSAARPMICPQPRRVESVAIPASAAK